MGDIADKVKLPLEPLMAMVEKCCLHIPEGYEIRLCMEEGSAWVELWLPGENKTELPEPADKTLLEQLNDAICVANGWAIQGEVWHLRRNKLKTGN